MAKLPDRPNSPPLDRRQRWWLLGAALGAFLPVTPHLPVWITGFTCLLMAWGIFLLAGQRHPPPRWLLNIITLAATLVVGFHFRTPFGKDAGVALLAVFMTLKLLETRTRRDALTVVLLAFFMALAPFFHSQSMGAAIAAIASVFASSSALIATASARQTAIQVLRLNGLMLMQGVPFMLVLFVLFPRISGPLWGLPLDAHSGLSGLSDNMAPGSISTLSMSDAIAFRVKFSGPAPRRHELYWRGPVLSSFDGSTWRVHPTPPLVENTLAHSGRPVDQEITLEPHNKPWLLALDVPASMPPNAIQGSDYQLFSRQPVASRLRYTVRSVIGASPGAGDSGPFQWEALGLPPDSNPKALALGRQMRQEIGPNGELIANRLLRYFRQQGLTYTLEPPLLGRDSIDEFLFSTRQGFCEHYAAAFVFTMRAAGVPARVVTGYQGGELNPVDDTWIIRQSDAHAWAEIWTQGKGWQRIDPTAMSAPLRISTNLAAALPQDSALPLIYRPELSWLRQLRFRWDAVGNAWNQWVLGYNTQKQMDLLRGWGFSSPDWRTLTATLSVFSGAVLLALALWALLPPRSRDPALAAWNRLSRKLARRDLARQEWEGPLDYAQRIARALPKKRGEIFRLAKLYETARYRHDASPEAAAQLRRAVAAFHP